MWARQFLMREEETTLMKGRIARLVVGLAATGALVVGLSAAPAFAAPTSPGTYGTAAPNAQCGTAAESGAFNAHNLVYGPNSSAFGLSGGAGGGEAGINNSSVCGNGP